MYRGRHRKGEATSGSGTSTNLTPIKTTVSISSLSSKNRSKERGGNIFKVFGVFAVVISVCLFSLTIYVLLFSPSTKTVSDIENEMEKEAAYLVNRAYETEKGIEDSIFKSIHEKEKDLGAKVAPIEDTEDDYNNNSGLNAASEAMLKQTSTWVDGEKKLKEKLKVLVDRQAKGLDIGVPVLTRYLGEDIPAFVTEGADIDEWKRQVEQKYEEMREEEKEWQQHMREYLQQQGEL